jgi:hypothetical protein
LAEGVGRPAIRTRRSVSRPDLTRGSVCALVLGLRVEFKRGLSWPRGSVQGHSWRHGGTLTGVVGAGGALVRQLVGRLRACDSFSGGVRVRLAPRIPKRRLWLVGTAAPGGGCHRAGAGPAVSAVWAAGWPAWEAFVVQESLPPSRILASPTLICFDLVFRCCV